MAQVGPLVGLMLLCVTGCVLAADPPGAAVVHTSSQPAVQHAELEGFGQPVSTETLQHSSGSGLVQNNQSITGTVTGDSASHLTTGANSITGDAFSGSTGLPSVVQNSGNNVLIQTGVIVNVQLKP
jgi:hypothetical protein